MNMRPLGLEHIGLVFVFYVIRNIMYMFYAYHELETLLNIIFKFFTNLIDIASDLNKIVARDDFRRFINLFSPS